MPQQQGFSHLALTVTDVKRSAEFYNRLLDGQVVFSGPDDVGPIEVLVAGGLMLGFRSFGDTPKGDAFSERRIGLDHVGFAVGDEDELEKWRARLDELGVKHSGIVKDMAGAHLNARDPDNIAIEFFTLAPQG